LLPELAACPSFALLGPGFGRRAPVLLRDLRPAPPSDATLFLAPFEVPAREALSFAAADARPLPGGDLVPDVAPPPLAVTFTAPGYAAAVARIRADIAAGDVYQVCYAVPATIAPCSGADLFAALMARGLPPYAAWVRLPDGAELVSASPELLLEIRGRRAWSRPMKGTAPPDEAAQLLASAKDEAELAMITDLVRNDLTPICEPRSVRVRRTRRLVRLPYAVQAVSDVAGRLRPGVTALAALAALHPGGSVTGAPKLAALARIRALEARPRGVWCGALGYCSGQRTTFSLLIRTAEREPSGTWTYRVGSGIVWDSDADRELDELRVKLGALPCATRP
jgi:anthranilate/para-aminobenzoate synthase component I